MNKAEKLKYIQALQERLVRKSRTDLLSFTLATMPTFEPVDFHRRYYSVLTKFAHKQIKKLMVFVPPQHGKSEGSTRRLPPFILGKAPNTKVAIVSYNAPKARKFNREIQRIIDSPEYHNIFPLTCLNASKVADTDSGTYLRNADECEIVGHLGGFKTVGVGGALTGEPVDVLIMDDLYKDAKTAWSATIRESVSDWYDTVAETRLHNNSQQLIVFTRWHEDDLAGTLLQKQGTYDPKNNPSGWVVVMYQAIKQGAPTEHDPRKAGEALWPERHGLEKLREVERRSPRTFSALYQQQPTIAGGNIIKEEWFSFVRLEEFNRRKRDAPIVFFIDTAYTDKSSNDPTGLIATCKIGNDLYITKAQKVQMKFPDLIRFIPNFVTENGYSSNSSIRIEPKANGLSVIDQLKEATKLNVTKTPTPRESKETRLNAVSPIVECGRVVLVEGAWNELFIDEVCGFPKKNHDEFVDLLCYAINYHIVGTHKQIDLTRLAKMINR